MAAQGAPQTVQLKVVRAWSRSLIRLLAPLQHVCCADSCTMLTRNEADTQLQNNKEQVPGGYWAYSRRRKTIFFVSQVQVASRQHQLEKLRKNVEIFGIMSCIMLFVPARRKCNVSLEA